MSELLFNSIGKSRMLRRRLQRMGRARYSKGYIILTDTNLWQAHWFAYVRDPETGIEKRQHRSKIVGTKAQMKRYQAEEELRKITHPIAANSGRVDETTLGGFMDKRWKPLHEGQWREESTRGTNEQLLDIIRGRFGTTPLDQLDKVELQAWLNEIAKKRSDSAIRHVRTFLKSICAEAIEQEYLAKDPARKLNLPNTRAIDKTVLDWEQLRKVFAALTQRDRLIIAIEVTVGLRPSELFALRQGSFNGSQFQISETIYRGKLRRYGKTPNSTTTVDLPAALAHQIQAWMETQEDRRPQAFLFPNADGGFILKENYLNRVLYPLREHTDGEGKQSGIPGIAKLNFQILRRTFSTLAQKHGTVKDVQRQMRHAKPDLTAEIYMQVIPESVQDMVSEMYENLLKPITEKVQ